MLIIKQLIMSREETDLYSFWKSRFQIRYTVKLLSNTGQYVHWTSCHWMKKKEEFFLGFFLQILVLKIYNWIKSLFQPVIMCIVIVERMFFFFFFNSQVYIISQELKYIGVNDFDLFFLQLVPHYKHAPENRHSVFFPVHSRN